MLYNIRYWWLLLSQGNRWTKYLAHPRIWRPRPCLLMFASLVALDGFYLLLSTKLIADLTPEWSGGSMFHLHKNSFLLRWNSCKQRSESWTALLFLIDCEQTLHHPLWTQLSHWQMFIQNVLYFFYIFIKFLTIQAIISFTLDTKDKIFSFMKYFEQCSQSFLLPLHKRQNMIVNFK